MLDIPEVSLYDEPVSCIFSRSSKNKTVFLIHVIPT